MSWDAFPARREVYPTRDGKSSESGQSDTVSDEVKAPDGHTCSSAPAALSAQTRFGHCDYARDPAAFLSVLAAIDFMQAHDWNDIRARCHVLARTFRNRVTELKRLENDLNAGAS